MTDHEIYVVSTGIDSFMIDIDRYNLIISPTVITFRSKEIFVNIKLNDNFEIIESLIYNKFTYNFDEHFKRYPILIDSNTNILDTSSLAGLTAIYARNIPNYDTETKKEIAKILFLKFKRLEDGFRNQEEFDCVYDQKNCSFLMRKWTKRANYFFN